uniref:RRM domain-containing protein n=2 Tax=Kalanchoe fedtschenkoi TaxID=63787 RepID=A0A7N0TQV5_KALFE
MLYSCRGVSKRIMDKGQQAEYTAFEEKVKRSVCLDYVSPQATESVLKEALNQFGNVKNVHFIPNYLGPNTIGRSVLIEMEDPKQSKDVIFTINKFPFMISGMPRPVRARAAEIEMFDHRPAKPGRKIKCRWVEPNDPDFKVAKRLKLLAKKHAAEAATLLKLQLEEEQKLAAQQSRSLRSHYKKFETLDGVMADGAIKRLGNRYNLNVGEE